VPGNGRWKLGQITAANNKLYAAGQLTHRIFEVDMEGNVTVLAGSGNSINSDGVGEAASFDNPLGATVSNDGSKLYVISGTPGTRALRVIQLRENDFVAGTGITGSWYDPTHDGEGFNIEILEGGVPLLYWYSYDGSGNQRWFVGVGVISGNQLVFDELIETSGGIFGPDFNPADVESVVVGSATFTFADCESGQMSYVIDGLSGSMNLLRLTRIDGLYCEDST
jgi:hypothetical protein